MERARLALTLAFVLLGCSSASQEAGTPTSAVPPSSGSSSLTAASSASAPQPSATASSSAMPSSAWLEGGGPVRGGGGTLGERGGTSNKAPPETEVQIGAIGFHGPAIPNAASVIEKAWPRVRGCYRKALGMDPTLEGTVTILLKVGATGEVQAVEIKGPKLEALDGCVKGTFMRLLLEPPAGGPTTVMFPITFALPRR